VSPSIFKDFTRDEEYGSLLAKKSAAKQAKIVKIEDLPVSGSKRQ